MTTLPPLSDSSIAHTDLTVRRAAAEMYNIGLFPEGSDMAALAHPADWLPLASILAALPHLTAAELQAVKDGCQRIQNQRYGDVGSNAVKSVKGATSP